MTSEDGEDPVKASSRGGNGGFDCGFVVGARINSRSDDGFDSEGAEAMPFGDTGSELGSWIFFNRFDKF